MNPQLRSEAAEARPLSYEDMRRFLLLVVSLILLAFAVVALAKIVLLFTIVFFLAMVLNPLVTWLEKRGLKRGLGVLLVMGALVAVIIGIGFLVVPPVMEQVNDMARNVPAYRQRIESQLQTVIEKYPSLGTALPGGGSIADLDQAGAQLAEMLGKFGPGMGGQLLARTLGLLGGIFFGLLALLLTSFVLANPQPLVAGFLAAVPERHRDAAGRSLARLSDQMLAWARATLINGAVTGLSTGILLWIVGVQPALVFGVLAFFGEFVPNLGPFVAAVPALFVAAGMGTTKFFWALAVIVFVQQVESNLLVPYIMGRVLELHPVTIIFFALSMGLLFGFAGAVLAVPAAALVKILYDEFYIKPNQVPEQAILERSQRIISDRVWAADNEVS